MLDVAPLLPDTVLMQRSLDGIHIFCYKLDLSSIHITKERRLDTTSPVKLNPECKRLQPFPNISGRRRRRRRSSSATAHEMHSPHAIHLRTYSLMHIHQEHKKHGARDGRRCRGANRRVVPPSPSTWSEGWMIWWKHLCLVAVRVTHTEGA